MIAIVNYNAGNIASLENALTKLGIKYVVTSDPKVIQKASKVIFPGQGRASQAMKELKKQKLVEVIRQIKVPFLGICLGMQILFEFSEEDDTKCLRILPGKVKKFRSKQLKIPQMGWNRVAFMQDDPIFNGIQSNEFFYFANSYYVDRNNEFVLGKGNYGTEFSAILRKDNFYGVQFHPEKSGSLGMKLLKNFCRLPLLSFPRKRESQLSDISKIPSKYCMEKDSKPFEILPAIDFLDGKCVRLLQGDYNKVTKYSDNRLEIAKQFASDGATGIHIIDLNGARDGKPMNFEIIKEIKKITRIMVQAGGGIRTFEDAKKFLKNGIDRIILGTSAIKNPGLIKKLVREFGTERIVVSVDAKNGMIATDGWKNLMNIPFSDFLVALKSFGIKIIIFTDILRDGMMNGPNFESIEKVLRSGFEVIVAGGISFEKDVEKIRRMGARGVVIGKAVYEGKINLQAVSDQQSAISNKYKTQSTKYKKSICNSSFVIRNSFAKRVIACMDIDKGRIVKGTNFTNLRDAGDPVELAKMYSKMGIDELVFLDITATNEKRKTLLELVKKVAKEIHIPFTVGGGIQSLDDIRDILKAGADKVSIGSVAVKNPELIRKAAREFGSQAIVISVDPKKSGKKWEIYINGGRENTGIDAIQFSKQMEKLGAGELLVNSLDRDGTKLGYDLELLQRVSENVNIPVIASSGAGTKKHFLEAFTKGKADAALAASLFHFRELEISDLKKYLRVKRIPLRI
ncbi:imidazole glycerol phosphate synthase subunit HisF [Candidatus Peregrinibacteria bacterium]|nr:imidazole glycerol phosphate synthase subunit HisF [Candidatus Peregrinibacteria bacterium]